MNTATFAVNSGKGFTVTELLSGLNALTEQEMRECGESFPEISEGETAYEKDGEQVFAPFEVIRLTTLATKYIEEMAVKVKAMKEGDAKNFDLGSKEFDELHALGHELEALEQKIEILGRMAKLVMTTNFAEEFCGQSKPKIGRDWKLFFEKPQLPGGIEGLLSVLRSKGIGIEVVDMSDLFDGNENPFEGLGDDEEFEEFSDNDLDEEEPKNKPVETLPDPPAEINVPETAENTGD